MNPSRLLVAVISVFALGQNSSAETAPINDKFVPYGGPGEIMDAEVKGYVAFMEGSTLWLYPDAEYFSLLIDGNFIAPNNQGTCDSAETGTVNPGQCGWFERRRFFADPLDFGLTETWPVIKLETYGVGEREGTEASAPPLLRYRNDNGQWLPVLDENGNHRRARVGDRIRVRGLYLLDYGHSMYYKYCVDPFVYNVGTWPYYKVCFAHSEIHPYNYEEVEWLDPETNPAFRQDYDNGQVKSETHVAVSPVHPQYYSFTWTFNYDLKRHFYEPASSYSSRHSFFVAAPEPDPGCPGVNVLDYNLNVTPFQGGGSGANYGFAYSLETSPEPGLRVTLEATGREASVPTVIYADVEVFWGCDF